MTTQQVAAIAVESRAQDIARRVRGLMGEQRINGTRVGAAIGVSNTALSRRLQGHVDFTVGELEALARFFSVDDEYLFGFSETRRSLVRHEGLEPPTRCFADQDRGPAVAALGVVLPFRRRGAVLPTSRPA